MKVTLQLLPRILIAPILAISLGLFLASCGGSGTGSSDNGNSNDASMPSEAIFKRAASFSEHVEILSLYFNADTIDRWQSYNALPSKYPNVAAWTQSDTPLQGEYLNYVNPIESRIENTYPEPNARVLFNPNGAAQELEENSIDLTNGAESEGDYQTFFGVRDATYPGGSIAVPVIIITRGIVKFRGEQLYRMVRVFEGFFVDRDLSQDGPFYDGNPGSIFTGTYSLYLTESLQPEYSGAEGLILSYANYLVRESGTQPPQPPPRDSDGDGVEDDSDNCPSTANPGQADTDRDGLGNACDNTPNGNDPDGDGIPDAGDNCPGTSNPDQADDDGDGLGNACDSTPQGSDPDQDGVPDADDNCPDVSNPDQEDSDNDGRGNACDDTPNGNDSSAPVAGFEFPLSGTRSNSSEEDQFSPAIDGAGSGRYVSAWYETDSAPCGSSFGCILGSTYTFPRAPNSLDSPIDIDDQRVNRVAPEIATDASGNSVVVWHAQYDGGNSNVVWMRRFDALGNPLGDREFMAGSVDFEPSVAMSEDGSRVAVGFRNGEPPFSSTLIVLRIYDADGVLVREIVAHPESGSSKTTPHVAMSADRILVVWQDEDTSGQVAITARLFDFDGNSLTAPFRVAENVHDNRGTPRVDGNLQGSFVVTWNAECVLPSPSQTSCARARVYDSNNRALTTGELVITDGGDNHGQKPDVSVLEDNTFVILWQHPRGIFDNEIRGQKYAMNGTPLGDQFPISIEQAGYANPRIASTGNGRFITAAQKNKAGTVRAVGRPFGPGADQISGTPID
ncbi:thrombospondin type 3 repeat-containing protein [Algiphilus sp.]|uniref:thrombospondin type 3 repeat-containing protein n=1 Tax=Algiphilus sp. TaxID=1872431 RepID=UPI003BAB179B